MSTFNNRNNDLNSNSGLSNDGMNSNAGYGNNDSNRSTGTGMMDKMRDMTDRAADSAGMNSNSNTAYGERNLPGNNTTTTGSTYGNSGVDSYGSNSNTDRAGSTYDSGNTSLSSGNTYGSTTGSKMGNMKDRAENRVGMNDDSANPHDRRNLAGNNNNSTTTGSNYGYNGTDSYGPNTNTSTGIGGSTYGSDNTDLTSRDTDATRTGSGYSNNDSVLGSNTNNKASVGDKMNHGLGKMMESAGNAFGNDKLVAKGAAKQMDAAQGTNLNNNNY